MADDPALDQTLDEVAAEIGEPIDGLVGGSFLRNFFVTVDYPNTTLRLQRYTKGAPTFDLFDRVGVGINPGTDGTSPSVAGVFAGTDAAKLGVANGDVIVAIDGHPLAKLGPSALNALLAGPLGSTKTVEFGIASSASLSMKTVTLGVDDILAL
jgi:C-terminal processing protease CtpA/Prc